MTRTLSAPRSSRVRKFTGLGLREQNKLDKLQRIRAAARALFNEKGFDAATTREIARRARVAHATVFIYARDKRDLVFLVLNDELEAETEEFLKAAAPGAPLLDQLSASFSVFYRYYGKNSKLARIFLKELTFYYEGEQAKRFGILRDKVIARLEQLLRDAQKSGSIRREADVALAARDLFFSYQGALRWWIAKPNSSARKGIYGFRKIIRLHLLALQKSHRST